MTDRLLLVRLKRRVASLKCKGLCWEGCGNLTFFPPEEARIRAHCTKMGIGHPARRGEEAPLSLLKTLITGDEMPFVPCRFLVDRRCSVYPVRPAVCRLFGACENMTCPFGCEMEGPPLTKEEAFLLEEEAVAGRW